MAAWGAETADAAFVCGMPAMPQLAFQNPCHDWLRTSTVLLHGCNWVRGRVS